MNAQAFTALAPALKHFPKLETLDFNVNNIGSAIRHLEGNVPETLRYLGLANNKIGEGGATALAKIITPNMPIETLELEDNNIGDEGLRQLLIGMPKTLKRLGLHDNDLADNATQHLVSSFSNLPELKDLELSMNPLTGRNLENLFRNNFNLQLGLNLIEDNTQQALKNTAQGYTNLTVEFEY